MKCAAVLLVVFGLPVFAAAAAHGPVFGLATPTNSQGEWSFDEGYSVVAQAVGRKLLYEVSLRMASRLT